MMNLVKRFRKEEKGATAIEYGLLAALIGVAIVVGATSLGDQVNSKFDDVARELCESDDDKTYTPGTADTDATCE